MRANELCDSVVATGGDAAPCGVHLGGVLRATDHSADLVAARAVGSGTLDGTITIIHAGEHGVVVRHDPRLTVGAP